MNFLSPITIFFVVFNVVMYLDVLMVHAMQNRQRAMAATQRQLDAVLKKFFDGTGEISKEDLDPFLVEYSGSNFQSGAMSDKMTPKEVKSPSKKTPKEAKSPSKRTRSSEISDNESKITVYHHVDANTYEEEIAKVFEELKTILPYRVSNTERAILLAALVQVETLKGNSNVLRLEFPKPLESETDYDFGLRLDWFFIGALMQRMGLQSNRIIQPYYTPKTRLLVLQSTLHYLKMKMYQVKMQDRGDPFSTKASTQIDIPDEDLLLIGDPDGRLILEKELRAIRALLPSMQRPTSVVEILLCLCYYIDDLTQSNRYPITLIEESDDLDSDMVREENMRMLFSQLSRRLPRAPPTSVAGKKRSGRRLVSRAEALRHARNYIGQLTKQRLENTREI